MSYLLPRLGFDAAEKEIDRFLESQAQGLERVFEWSLPEGARYAPTGGSPVPTYLLNDLRARMLVEAERAGFGFEGADINTRTFDQSLAVLLADQELFRTGEALDDEVWNFIGTALAPDLVYWRFGTTRGRYLGGVRNTFQRLWMRGIVLDRGQDSYDRWLLLESLTEDAAVQLFERTSIAGDSALSRSISEAWVRAAVKYGKENMQSIMRKAMILVRMRNVIQMLSVMDRQLLATRLDDMFDAASGQ